MGEYIPMKTKRKEIEDVYDDFSDFSLLSPARKIRRLDAELPPIIEESEPNGGPVDIDLDLDTQLQEEACVPVNEERAIVLYNPVNSSVSPNVSITVNPGLFPSFKNGVLWPGHYRFLISEEDELASEEKNDCLAVVPWVSNPLTSAQAVAPQVQQELSEPMDIEEDCSTRGGVDQSGIMYGSDGVLPHWQQQHCMTPEVPPNAATTPVMWSW